MLIVNSVILHGQVIAAAAQQICRQGVLGAEILEDHGSILMATVLVVPLPHPFKAPVCFLLSLERGVWH